MQARIYSATAHISSMFLTLLSPPGAVQGHCRYTALPLLGRLHLDVSRRAAPLPHCQEPQGGQLHQRRQIQEEVHVPCRLRGPSSDCGCISNSRTQELWNIYSVSMMSAFMVEVMSITSTKSETLR